MTTFHNALTLVENQQDLTVGITFTDMQLTARDLHARGLNVVPGKYGTKLPYILSPFFTSRAHHCYSTCHHPGKDDIAEIFKRTNIAVMVGRTSGNLMAIDCDSQKAFLNMGKQLVARELPFWAITGMRGGAYLLRVIEGEVANMPKDKSRFADVEIWGNRHIIFMPPSVHPSGVVYQWATPEPRFSLPPSETIPAVSVADLEWLGVVLQLEARKHWEEPDLYGLPEQYATLLSIKNRQTYADELTEGERNKRIFDMACDMRANGVDYYEAERAVMDVASRVGTPSKEALATLKSAYKKDRTRASEFFKDGPNGGGLREWQIAQAFAESFDWRGTFGRKALKRRAVFLACVERARRDGRTHWRATAREVAELANLNKGTAAESLHDLLREKLIKRVNDVKHRDAGIYRFSGLSVVRTVGITGSYSVRNLDTPKSQAEQDIFGKIGLVSWHVWRYLLQQSAKGAGEIARATCLPRSSVYAALNKLTHNNVGLVSRAEGIYYGEPRTDASLAHMAAFWHDGASPSQNRKQAHKLERERRVNRLVIGAIRRDEG